MWQNSTNQKTVQKQLKPDVEQDILELKQYRTDEAAGLLLRLPVPLGTPVWQVKNNPACHCGVQDAETFLYGRIITPPKVVVQIDFSLALLDEWGYTVFATEAEAKNMIERDAIE